ncbi:MAG: hypothetical protein JXO72_10525 [Vicinamibacteria bacterium]|nr:hypothetical protein [Vicinamibacteria bacterium]
MPSTNSRLLSSMLACLALAGSACSAERPDKPGNKTLASSQAAPSGAAKTIIYYFHGTYRCHTCRTIQAYAEDAVKAAFGPELASGEIVWRPKNVDESENEHFIKDYRLYTRSLVVVDGADAKRFKNLDKVWRLVRDKTVFAKYVQDEVRAFRKS